MLNVTNICQHAVHSAHGINHIYFAMRSLSLLHCELYQFDLKCKFYKMISYCAPNWEIRTNIDLYHRRSNAHTLTVIHRILKQHAANPKSRIFEEKVGSLDSLVIECDYCNQWQHHICRTEVTHQEHRTALWNNYTWKNIYGIYITCFSFSFQICV